MEKIDYESWQRREQFEFFSAVSNPFYSVTFNVDVTNVYEYAKKNGLSFYYALTYLVTKAVNSVDAFKLCIKNGEVYKLNERIASFTDIKPGSESFYIVDLPCADSIDDFCREAKRRSEQQSFFIDMQAESDELIYISCLPWIELTAMTNERNFDADDSIPRIAWGKYTEVNGRKKLGMSLELNHRFTDGVHIGKFNEKLCELIEKL